MGFWGTSLYENDYTCDVRDTYTQFLEAKCSNEVAYQKTIESFEGYQNTEEEPLFWYAIADTQWRFGRLMPEVKLKAMYWLQEKGGLEHWKGNDNGEIGWQRTMKKLQDKLNLPQPRTKKFEYPADFQYNPGNVGDLFAYRFHTVTSKKMGYYGKYLLLQKIGIAENSRGIVCPHFLFFDELFDENPSVINLNGMKVLPFDVPERFIPSGRNTEFPKLNMSAVLDLAKKRNSPSKYMSYIGTYPVHCTPTEIGPRAEFGWDCIESTLLYYHSEWRLYSYQLYDGESVVIPL